MCDYCYKHIEKRELTMGFMIFLFVITFIDIVMFINTNTFTPYLLLNSLLIFVFNLSLIAHYYLAIFMFKLLVNTLELLLER